MIDYKFACIIISHGRPDDIPTINALYKSGYSGNIYIVIDDEDKCKQEYITLYKDNVIVFHKQDFIDKNNLLFNKSLRNVAVHARNAVEDIVKKLGLEYFLVLDDDITNFHYRYVKDCKLHSDKLYDLDSVINLYIQYMITSSISTIGFAHDGMFLGGNTKMFDAPYHSKNRILANAFLRSSKYNVIWGPDMCEDFITSINAGIKSSVWMTLPFIGIHCKQQGMNKSKSDGGNSEAYLDKGNYGVSQYALLSHPDCYKISKNVWFECISYDLIVPKIISNKYKKV